MFKRYQEKYNFLETNKKRNPFNVSFSLFMEASDKNEYIKNFMNDNTNSFGWYNVGLKMETFHRYFGRNADEPKISQNEIGTGMQFSSRVWHKIAPNVFYAINLMHSNKGSFCNWNFMAKIQ